MSDSDTGATGVASSGVASDDVERSEGGMPPLSVITLSVNDQERRLEVDPRTSLLDALREHLHLSGTKKGCDHGQCGACTVLINGRRVNACLTLAVMHEGDDVVTIEGLGDPEGLHAMQLAFVECDGFQCGYCTPGQRGTDRTAAPNGSPSTYVIPASS